MTIEEIESMPPDQLRKLIGGVFVVTDGIDLGGKEVALDAITLWIKNHGLKEFDLAAYQKETLRTWPDDLLSRDFDILISAEPPYAGGGWDLRNGPLKRLESYTANETADMFSSYRIALFGEVIEPVLNDKTRYRAVFQQRSVSSSIVFQPLQSRIDWDVKQSDSADAYSADKRINKPIDVNYIMSLSGNQRALATPPSLLIVMLCEPHEVLRRGKAREKKDDCKFEKHMQFLTEVDKAYRSNWFKDIFEKQDPNVRSSEVVRIDTTDIQVEDTKRLAVEEWLKFLDRRYQKVYKS